MIVACAGGAAHLPGMVAAATPLPVIGIPRLERFWTVWTLCRLLCRCQLVPVATVSIGGAKNAGLLAIRTLAQYSELPNAWPITKKIWPRKLSKKTPIFAPSSFGTRPSVMHRADPIVVFIFPGDQWSARGLIGVAFK